MPPRSADPLIAIDLFCGAGGLTQGFRSAGFEVTFALDSDHDSCESYKKNHRATDVAVASITDLSPADIKRRAGGHIDVVIGGPSCQGFSTARKQRWHDPDSDRNTLWRRMLEVVDEAKPRAFIIENVPGMVMWREGNFGEQILAEFRNLGYSVAEPQILLAADYGVPQRRRRLFIVGLRGDDEFAFPDQTHMGGWRRDTLDLWEARRVEAGLLRHVSCWEALADLPLLEDLDGTGRPEYVDVRLTPYIRRMRGQVNVLRDHETYALGDDHRALIGHVPQGGTWRDIPRHLLPDRLRGMRRTDSSNLFGRLDPSLPSYTITTQFPNVTVGCNTHPYEDRPLTVREAARLQSFPDRYKFVGSIDSRARQVGNAVPPLLAQRLAESIAQQLGVEIEPAPPIRPASQTPAPPTSTAVRKRLAKQAKKDTKPETLLRDALDRRGVTGYETEIRPLEDLRRTADLGFVPERFAIFVDGCFWHGCPTHARATKSNTKWWREKIEANQIRDADTTARLVAAGWTVLRVWEHEDPEDAARRVAKILDELREGLADGPAAATG